MTGSYGSFSLNFFEEPRVFSIEAAPTVYEGSLSPHPFRHLLLLVILIIANLVGVREREGEMGKGGQMYVHKWKLDFRQ